MSNKKTEGILKGLNKKDNDSDILKINRRDKKKNKTFNISIEAIEIIDVIAYKNKMKKNEVLEEAIRNYANKEILEEVNKRINK